MQLWVAGIAALAALLGALIGGGASYLSTRQQVSAQAEQARADYFRAQRKEAYSRAVEAEYSLYGREQSYLSGLFPDGLNKPEGIDDDAQTLAFTEENGFMDDYNALLQEHSNVLLLGSSDVALSSHDLTISHKKLVDLILDASEAPSYETASETAARAEALLRANDAVIEDRASLLHMVRTDLGIVD